MEWRDQVLAEIGQGMGIQGLDFSGTGVVSFEFEQRGTLYYGASGRWSFDVPDSGNNPV